MAHRQGESHPKGVKGVKGETGKVPLFRLMASDDGEDETSGIELKAVDVTTPGDYELSTESLWRSKVRVRGDLPARHRTSVSPDSF